MRMDSVTSPNATKATTNKYSLVNLRRNNKAIQLGKKIDDDEINDIKTL